MYSYYTITYNSKTIHVVKAQADANEDVQISLMADRYDSADPLKLASDFHDYELEGAGWTRIAVINGGIFNSAYAPIIYANGIEKAYWTLHEYDDSSLDDVMAISHTGDNSNSPIIELQSAAKGNINSYRGAVTAAFGLLRNGVVDQGSTSDQGSYNSLSGRSIIGKDASGAIYFAAVAGTTGSSGLTGTQCIELAQTLGLTDAVAMDGGGSVSLIFQDVWRVSTTRQVKNAYAIYVRAKGGEGPGGGEDPTFQEFKDSGFMPIFETGTPHKIMINGQLQNLIDIKIKQGSQLISVINTVVE